MSGRALLLGVAAGLVLASSLATVAAAGPAERVVAADGPSTLASPPDAPSLSPVEPPIGPSLDPSDPEGTVRGVLEWSQDQVDCSTGIPLPDPEIPSWVPDPSDAALPCMNATAVTDDPAPDAASAVPGVSAPALDVLADRDRATVELEDDVRPGRTRAPDDLTVDGAPSAPAQADPGLDRLVLVSLALLTVPAWWLYRRLSDDDLLDNATRRRVYERIDGGPGATAADVARDADLDYDTVRYHLDILEEFDRVTSVDVDGKHRYFVNGGRFSHREKRWLAVAAAEPRRRMLAELSRDGRLLAGELARRADVAPSTASFHLDRLHESGLVERDRRGNEVRYRVASDVPSGLFRRIET